MKIKDICTSVTDGSHNPPQGIEKSEYMMLSSKNIFDDEITFDEPRFLSEKDFEREHKRTQIAVGDVLLTIVGTVGRTAVVDEDMPAFALQRSVAVLHPKNDVCLPRFLMYALRGKRTYIENRAKGVAQKGIYLKEVSDIDIYIPDISNQEIIINKLDKVNTIIKLRQEELLALDNLIKARFVEMFGNPVTNEKVWKQRQLGEITTKIGSGATPKGGKEAYQEEGITLIRSMNVHNGLFEYKELAHISEEQAEKLDNVTIEENDVLLNITGASVARSCVVPSKILPARVNQHVCIIRCNQCIVPEFLNKLLIDDNYQRLLWSIAEAGATREAITKQQVESLQIIMPPIELQEQFADFVHQVDKSKFDTMTFAPIYAIINLYLHTYFYQGRR